MVMSKRQYISGCLKRKRKHEKDKAEEAMRGSIHKFLKTSNDSSVETANNMQLTVDPEAGNFNTATCTSQDDHDSSITHHVSDILGPQGNVYMFLINFTLGILLIETANDMQLAPELDVDTADSMAEGTLYLHLS